jgi:predicted transcriptional regulator
MFDFIFKRATETSAIPSSPAAVPSQEAAASATAGRRDEQAQRAAALNGDEAAAVALILESEFASVRQAAAEHVHTPAALEQVMLAVRNSDRRVAKLMQGRLDAIRYQQSEHQKAQACLDQAQRLLQDEKLTPNQVAELDRQWQIVSDVPALAEAYASARAALAARLETQVNLQRKIIDAMAAVRKLPQAGLPAEEALSALDGYAAEQSVYQEAPEHNALPRHLLSDYAQAVEQARAALAKPAKPAAAEPVPAPAGAAASGAARSASPAAAGTAASDASGAATVSGASDAAGDAVTHDASPAAPGAAAPARPPKQPKPAPKETDKKFLETLDALEAALEHGQLHIAAEHDKWLREHKTRLSHAQTEHLNHVRAELKRLGDWARWGGNVSREELVKAVEELPAQKLAMSELAKKVGSMRDRWKQLDAVSGHAPKSLWERFDTACTNAYAPAAAHFKQLADERHASAAKAQALIEETQALAASVANGADLKNVAAAGQRLRQMWGRLGTIDRKEKRKLDQTFDKVLANMLAPLSEQRKIEAAKREELIAEAEALDATDRHTLDKVRRLQERWQEHAKALPLDRKVEQALWQRFRAACDAIFAKRKESAHAADHERKAHLHAREAICKELEDATFSGEDKAQLAAIAKALKDAAAAWHATGVVPRAAEARIGQRYHNAVGKVQAQADAIKRRAGAAQANALRDKLRLCQALENAIANEGEAIDAAEWQAKWAALPSLGNDYERALAGRFNAAVAAIDGKRAAYAQELERNRAKLLDEVLRLEIVAGVDSGAEFARERLKMHVEVLQSSLKSGQKPQSASAAYLQLCTMPALADARTSSRIEQLFRRIGGAERA